MPSTPLDELTRRIHTLKQKMEESSIDACLMVQKTDVFLL